MVTPASSAMPTFAINLGRADSIIKAGGIADTLFMQMPGHRLFTLTAINPDGAHVTRLYSSMEKAYSKSGTKPMLDDAWNDQVIRRGEVFLGYIIDDVKDYFPDFQALADMGLGATINAPVLFRNQVIGTVNLLDRPNAYTAEDAQIVFAHAQLFCPYFLEFRYAYENR